MSETVFRWRKFREARERMGLTLADAAEGTGISVSYLSKIENGKANLSIAQLKRLADFYGIPMRQLIATDDSAQKPPAIVIKAHRGPRISQRNSEVELLLPGLSQHMEPSLTVYPPDTESDGLIKHPGEEFNYVLEGKVIYIAEDREWELGPGDSIYHKGSVTHGWRNPFAGPCKVLSIVTPPSLLMTALLGEQACVAATE